MPTSSTNPDTASTTRIVMDVSKDGWTKGIQLGISELDENDGGHGYRIGGPKYNGSSTRLLTCELTQRDADEIRSYLDSKFPHGTDAQGRRLPVGFRRDVVIAVKCTVCEYEYDEDESYTAHFDSVKQATDAVKDAGWTVLADGRVVCDSDDEDHVDARKTGGER